VVREVSHFFCNQKELDAKRNVLFPLQRAVAGHSSVLPAAGYTSLLPGDPTQLNLRARARTWKRNDDEKRKKERRKNKIKYKKKEEKKGKKNKPI
jgi:hypothetical protein